MQAGRNLNDRSEHQHRAHARPSQTATRPTNRLPRRIGPSGDIQNAVVDEELHDAIQVMSIKRRDEVQ